MEIYFDILLNLFNSIVRLLIKKFINILINLTN